MTLNTLKIAKRMQDAGMPPEQSEALAIVLDEEVRSDLVTSTELGAAVDRLESRIDVVEQRLDAKIDRLDDKLATSLIRVENTMRKVGLAILGGGLAIGGLLIRFVR